MAAVGLFLAVVVEGHSAHTVSETCMTYNALVSHFIGVFCGLAAMLYLVARAIIVVSSAVVVVVALFVNTIGIAWDGADTR
jgi:hypothetical protein